MKKTPIILLVFVLLFSVSCEKECEDEMRYKGLAKSLAQIDKDIEEIQNQIEAVDMEEDIESFVKLQDDLTLLTIDKVLTEIEMETLKNESDCF